jgi:hypothetical protein
LQVEEEDFEMATHVLEEGLDAPAFHAGQAAPPEETDLSVGAQRTPRFPAGVFIACGVALVALLFVATQGRARKNSWDVEDQKVETDQDGDGKADTVWTYHRRVLARMEMDKNGDGKPDVWQQYDDRGVIKLRMIDDNYDGTADSWFYYDHGQIYSGKLDRDHNGVPDVFETYKNDRLDTAEVRPNGSAVPLRRQKYVDGILREEVVDANQDGHPDYRIEYDPFGTPSEHLSIESAK